MRTFFLLWMGSVCLLFALWFLVSIIAGLENERSYLSLVRGGILISALVGMTAGFIYRSSRFVWLALVVLIVGYLTYWLAPGAAAPATSLRVHLFIEDIWWRAKEGFLRPRGPQGSSLADLTAVGLILGNAAWFLRGLAPRRILGGNLLILAVAFAMSLLLPQQS